MNTLTQEEAVPHFLEPTPKRIRALAWAFTWRYQAGYALAFYVLIGMFGESLSGSPFLYSFLLLIFYAGKGLPRAITRALYYKPLRGAKMVLVVNEKVIDPSRPGWSNFFDPYQGLVPFFSAPMGTVRDHFTTPDRVFTTLFFVCFSSIIALFIFLPKGLATFGIYALVSLFPLVEAYVLSYYAFKRALNKTSASGKVRLMAHDAEKESVTSEDFSVHSEATPLETLQIAWAFLWRNLAFVAGIGLPLMFIFFCMLILLHIKPDIKWLNDPLHQTYLWLLLLPFECFGLLLIFHLMNRAKIGDSILCYQYRGQIINKRDVTLVQWLRLHLPFLMGYIGLGFIVWQIKKALSFDIKLEALDSLWDNTIDLLILYLLFAVLTQYTCLKSRYVILRKPSEESSV